MFYNNIGVNGPLPRIYLILLPNKSFKILILYFINNLFLHLFSIRYFNSIASKTSKPTAQATKLAECVLLTFSISDKSIIFIFGITSDKGYLGMLPCHIKLSFF